MLPLLLLKSENIREKVWDYMSWQFNTVLKGGSWIIGNAAEHVSVPLIGRALGLDNIKEDLGNIVSNLMENETFKDVADWLSEKTNGWVNPGTLIGLAAGLLGANLLRRIPIIGNFIGTIGSIALPASAAMLGHQCWNIGAKEAGLTQTFQHESNANEQNNNNGANLNSDQNQENTPSPESEVFEEEPKGWSPRASAHGFKKTVEAIKGLFAKEAAQEEPIAHAHTDDAKIIHMNASSPALELAA